MNETTERQQLPLLARILRGYYRTKWRGATRTTLLLARYAKSLQNVPIQIGDGPAIYVDLRMLNSHFWLIGTPFDHSPLELDEQTVMRRFVRQGDTVFDIGANFGVHTALLAQLTGPRGRVFAFEPNPELLAGLALIVERLGNVTVSPYALSDEDTQAVFFIPSDRTMSSLADWTSLERMPEQRQQAVIGKTSTITVQQQRIDDLARKGDLPVPDFIKCDVEGAELKVFRGGRETLDRVEAPVVLFEAGPESAHGFGFAMTDAADFLVGLQRPGYQLFEVQAGGTLRPIGSAELKKQNQNVLAVPRSQHARCPELA
jgi:FkbM family methyltransferase